MSQFRGSTGSPPANRSVASCNRYRQITGFGITPTSLEKRCRSVRSLNPTRSNIPLRRPFTGRRLAQATRYFEKLSFFNNTAPFA
ncbi:hypothetical protein [Burkholderia lata]|uniref:Uncharacterized protein n=1 Tax=Burkholderia lata (strain ATCC 17760 / DSM 23089 / LMG 22485 / NCIMB 9086 / R18194 / 383) TaxID=482957 RepID=A0A6P2K6K7_BURL3|nr:hypothetical protein [Burkholderia lata]VWB52800.1 hypothetical protein BLA6863_02418 [Burkholderia lata]